MLYLGCPSEMQAFRLKSVVYLLAKGFILFQQLLNMIQGAVTTTAISDDAQSFFFSQCQIPAEESA